MSYLFPVGTTFKYRGSDSIFQLVDTGVTIQLRNTSQQYVWQAKRMRPDENGMVDLSRLSAKPQDFKLINIPKITPTTAPLTIADTPWYFLPGTDQDIAKLAKVTIIPTTITKPKQLKGFSFPKEDLETVKNILGLTGYFEPTQTDQVGVGFLQKTLSPEEKETQPKEKERIALQKTKDAYITECKKRKNTVVSEAKRKITAIQEAIKNCTQILIEKSRDLPIELAKLEALEKMNPEAEKMYSIEFDNLVAMPHVKKVEINGGDIVVYTDTLFIEHNKNTYELGDYKINLNQNGIEIINLRARELTGDTAWHHPHINYETGQCLGNVNQGVALLIVNYQYAIATGVIIEFLQTAYYTHRLTKKWKPMKKEDKKKKVA